MLALHQPVDFVVGGKAVGRQLGKCQTAADRDLERADTSRDQCHLFNSRVSEPFSRTESARFVVSSLTIFDLDRHGTLLADGQVIAIIRESITYLGAV